MAHKTLISGTAYSVTGGRELIGGTGYAKKKGRVLVNGTGYDIPFSSGIPIGTLPVGSVVKIGVNGKSYDFLVVNQGIPSGSSIYDSSCDGTWMLIKYRYKTGSWGDNYAAQYGYEKSGILRVQKTIFDEIDEPVRSAIKDVKIPYYSEWYSLKTGANGLQVKTFDLSLREVSDVYPGNKDGAKLSYFSRGVDMDYWWLRTPYDLSQPSLAFSVQYQGSVSTTSVQDSYACRTAFILPGTFLVIQNPDGTYSPAA